MNDEIYCQQIQLLKENLQFYEYHIFLLHKNQKQDLKKLYLEIKNLNSRIIEHQQNKYDNLKIIFQLQKLLLKKK